MCAKDGEKVTVDWEIEAYAPMDPDSTELAQLIWDTGLLYMLNCAVLHPQGLAIGVSTSDTVPTRVTGLNLHRTSDPEGVWYGEDLTMKARQKLLAAGLVLRSPQRESSLTTSEDELDRLAAALHDWNRERGGLRQPYDVLIEPTRADLRELAGRLKAAL